VSEPAPVVVGTRATGLAPLTVGMAGHIDHGKTALVAALTGVDTHHLPSERERGMTIALGYAPLLLPSGRRVSLIDVPGHERLVRTMVAGATGIDMYLLAVAADDGVMPQTIEHVRVLEALGVERGVVAVTKSDIADPTPAIELIDELLPGATPVACSSRSGAGVAAVAAALDAVAAQVSSRAEGSGSAVLHVDRVFTIHGSGTVVTGTLWSGTVTRGDQLKVLPSGRDVRVRGVQVHDEQVASASAGQRVAINLSGVPRGLISPGDVLADAQAPLSTSYRVEVELTTLREPLADRERVTAHHGTRSVAARVVHHEGDYWQLRCERPLIFAQGDRLVVRRQNPPQTLGGGVILRAGTKQRQAPAAALPRAEPTLEPSELSAAALALEQLLLEAGFEPPNDADLGDRQAQIPALVAAGRVVRIGRAMHAHVDAVADVRARVEQVIRAEGSITLARARDELDTSRKYAQALLEHLDAARVTRRQDDDSRVLRGQI